MSHPFDPINYRYEFVDVDPKTRTITYRKERREKPLDVSPPTDPRAPRVKVGNRPAPKRRR